MFLRLLFFCPFDKVIDKDIITIIIGFGFTSGSFMLPRALVRTQYFYVLDLQVPDTLVYRRFALF
jgi:hypothetical protein